MRTRWLPLLSACVLALSVGAVGCADQSEEPAGPPQGSSEEEYKSKQLSDDALQGKLKGILTDVTFTSESDYPYVVFEGDGVTEKRLSTKLVRDKLRSAVKSKSSSHRDIQPATCRSSRLNVSQAIADGDAADVPADRTTTSTSTRTTTSSSASRSR